MKTLSGCTRAWRAGFALLLALAAAAAPAGEITIGVVAELTGAGATYGRGIVQGAEMALRDVNAAGGIDGQPLRMMVVDGATNPARSAIVMRRLVAISANAMPADLARGHEAGFAAYLTKPLDVARFTQLLDRLLDPARPSAAGHLSRP